MPIAQPPVFAERLGDTLARTEYRPVREPAEREAIFALRHRAYVAQDVIAPNATGKISDYHDDSPNCQIIGVHIDGELIGSIRFSVLTPSLRSSPCYEVFADVLEPMLDAGHTIVDPSRFVADPDVEKRIPELPYITLRLAYLACVRFNASYGLGGVRPNHRAFYRKLFRHVDLTGPRLAPPMVKPVVLTAVDFPRHKEEILQLYPFLGSTAAERAAIFPTLQATEPA